MPSSPPYPATEKLLEAGSSNIHPMRPLYVVNNYGQFNHLILRSLRDMGIPGGARAQHDPAGGDSQRMPGDHPGWRAHHGEGRQLQQVPGPRPSRPRHLPRDAGHGPGPGRGRSPRDPWEATALSRLRSSTPMTSSRDTRRNKRVGVPHGRGDQAARWVQPPCQLADLLIEAMANPKEHLYGVQWHPEVSHTVDGRLTFENFDRICREP